MAGNKTRCNKKVVDLLTKARRLGLPLSQAAKHVGVNEGTVYIWLRKGKEAIQSGHGGIYRQLVEDLDRAEADRAADSLLRIHQAAKGGEVVERTTTTITDAQGNQTTRTVERKLPADWKADAFFLERRHPDEFGRRLRQEVVGEDGGPVKVQTWVELMRRADDEEEQGGK